MQRYLTPVRAAISATLGSFRHINTVLVNTSIEMGGFDLEVKVGIFYDGHHLVAKSTAPIIIRPVLLSGFFSYR